MVSFSFRHQSDHPREGNGGLTMMKLVMMRTVLGDDDDDADAGAGAGAAAAGAGAAAAGAVLVIMLMMMMMIDVVAQ